MRLSGLEPCNISAHVGFVNVGERTNVTGSKAFARMILNGQYDEALSVARQQVENGEVAASTAARQLLGAFKQALGSV